MVLGPTSVHLNWYWLSVVLLMAQLSEDPLLMLSAVIVAKPIVLRYTVLFCVRTLGLIVSLKSTTADAESMLPFTSVTYNQMVLVPASLQSKDDWLKVMFPIEQLSDEPLSIWAVPVTACPLASRYKVIFWVMTVGLIWSITVTTADAESMLPFTSVTLR